MKKTLNLLSFIIVIILTVIASIIGKSMFILIIVPIFYMVYSNGKQYLNKENQRNDLFVVTLFKYVGIIYILIILIISIVLSINKSNIVILYMALPGIIIMIYPYIKRYLKNKKNFKL